MDQTEYQFPWRFPALAFLTVTSNEFLSYFFATKSQGTGLGLAICRSIIAANGGHLSASRAAPYGSVFRVDLLSAVEEKRALIF
jgi:K+-sensing histidine kinase KdpD